MSGLSTQKVWLSLIRANRKKFPYLNRTLTDYERPAWWISRRDLLGIIPAAFATAYAIRAKGSTKTRQKPPTGSRRGKLISTGLLVSGEIFNAAAYQRMLEEGEHVTGLAGLLMQRREGGINIPREVGEKLIPFTDPRTRHILANPGKHMTKAVAKGLAHSLLAHAAESVSKKPRLALYYSILLAGLHHGLAHLTNVYTESGMLHSPQVAHDARNIRNEIVELADMVEKLQSSRRKSLDE